VPPEDPEVVSADIRRAAPNDALVDCAVEVNGQLVCGQFDGDAPGCRMLP
jgi:hypothetical protein